MTQGIVKRVQEFDRRNPWAVTVGLLPISVYATWKSLVTGYPDFLLYSTLALSVGFAVLFGFRHWKTARRKHISGKERWRGVAATASQQVTWSVIGFNVLMFCTGQFAALQASHAYSQGDANAYFRWTLMRGYAVEPAALTRAQELGSYGTDPKMLPCGAKDSADRKQLIADTVIPPVFRAAMLNEDAVCAQHAGREVDVASDLEQISALPMQPTTSMRSAFQTAYFSMHDKIATRMLLMDMRSRQPMEFSRIVRLFSRDRSLKRILDEANS